PRARESTKALHLVRSILSNEYGDLNEAAVNGSVERDDVSPVRVPKFLDVPGRPDIGERRPEGFDDNGLSSDLIRNGGQDGRMKDNAMAEGRRSSRKIGFLQRGRQGSLFYGEHSGFPCAIGHCSSPLGRIVAIQ